MTTPQKASAKQEKDLSQALKDGLTQPASGSFWSRKGDVRSSDYLAEAKRTDRESISVKKHVWRKIRREALLDGRTPILALQIQELDLVVLDMEDFLALISEPDLGEGELP